MINGKKTKKTAPMKVFTLKENPNKFRIVDGDQVYCVCRAGFSRLTESKKAEIRATWVPEPVFSKIHEEWVPYKADEQLDIWS